MIPEHGLDLNVWACAHAVLCVLCTLDTQDTQWSRAGVATTVFVVVERPPTPPREAPTLSPPLRPLLLSPSPPPPSPAAESVGENHVLSKNKNKSLLSKNKASARHPPDGGGG